MYDTESFYLEEYKALRKEVEIYLAECRSQERYTLIAVGVIWAWLVTHRLQYGLLWAVPIMLTLATSLRMIAILKHFNQLHEYLLKMEDRFKGEGWEHKKKGWTLGAAFVLLDVLLLVLAIVAWEYRVDLTSLPCP